MMEAMTSSNIGACCAAALSGCVCFVEVANKSDPRRTIASKSSLAGVVEGAQAAASVVITFVNRPAGRPDRDSPQFFGEVLLV